MSNEDDYEVNDVNDDAEWHKYTQKMQKMADAQKGVKVKSAAEYDPDQEPVATDTGRVQNRPMQHAINYVSAAMGRGVNTGKSYDKPMTKKQYLDEVGPIPTNTGKSHAVKSKKQHMKEIEDKAYKDEKNKRNAAKVESEEKKAVIRGTRRAMPYKEKVIEGVTNTAVTGAKVAGKTYRGIKAADKAIGKSVLLKEFKQMTSPSKRVSIKKVSKKAITAREYNAIPENKFSLYQEKDTSSLSNKNTLYTEQKDTSGLSHKNTLKTTKNTLNNTKNTLNNTKNTLNMSKQKNPFGNNKKSITL
jgi:hypothetical protein